MGGGRAAPDLVSPSKERAPVPLLSYEIEIVIRRNQFKCRPRIGLPPFFRRLVPLSRRPFALETEQPTVTLFDIVNLFPVVGAPEVKGSVYPGVRSFIQTLGHDEVFSQGAAVIARSEAGCTGR